MKLVRRKGLKIRQNSKQGPSERECQKLEARPFPTLGGCGEHLMFKTEHVGRKSEDAFLLFELTHLKQRASVSKFALSHLNEFQLEVKSEEGKFASV